MRVPNHFSVAHLLGKLSLAGLLFIALSVRATYLGGDPPHCQTCPSCQKACAGGTCKSPVCPPVHAGGGSSISLTEGNLLDDYSVATFSSSGGDTLELTLTYNSYNADASRAHVNTMLGLGWTHSYNLFLFEQNGSMFFMDGVGRILKFQAHSRSTYTAATGYFEKLVRNLDGSFTMTTPDLTVFEFARVPNTPFLVQGEVYRLTSVSDRNHNTTTLSYSNGNLITITDTYGRRLRLNYNSQNNLVSITDPLNHTTTLLYDSGGKQLLRITDPAGKSISYSYNFMNQLTAKTDKDGRRFSYLFSQLMPVAIVDGSGRKLFSLTNPGNWAVNRTNLAFNLTRQYLPNTTSKTDGRTNTWRYDYDQNGQVTRSVAPDLSVTAYGYDPVTLKVAFKTNANGAVTAYKYDLNGNVTNVTDALGNVTTYTYEPVFNQMTSMTDPKGRITLWQYDAVGNRTNEIDPLLQTLSWTYDSHGNVLTDTDKNGHTTTYLYDPFGNRTNRTDALGNVTAMTYDAVGNLLSRTDANNHTTTFQYDRLNRLIKQTDPAGKTTQTVYDGEGDDIQVIDRNNHTNSFHYDQRRRLVATIDALGQAETEAYDGNNNSISTTDRNGHTTSYIYDVQNRLIKTTDARGNVTSRSYDPAGNVLTATDANLHATTYTYDALNRRITATDALGNVSTTEYDNGMEVGCTTCGATPGSSLVTKQTDANGKVTYFKYDELNRLTDVVRKVGATNDTITVNDAVTTTTYDPVGKVLTVKEPNGDTTAYEYDALNRRTRTTNAAGDVTQTTYDGVGNIFSITAPNLNVRTYVYDALDRATQVNDSLGLVASHTYDPVGNRLSQTDGNGSTTTFTYDTINRLINVTDPLGEKTLTQYDPVGNVLNVTDRNGNVTTLTYDEINRRTNTTDALGHIVQFQYDGVGNLHKITDANGHTTQYTYDNINRLIQETYPDGPPNTRTFTYDAVGNRLTRTDQKGQTTAYNYNDLYFLLQRSYPVSPADNFTYDLSGRMLTAERGGWLVTYLYDGANRITNTTQNGQAIDYVYNIPGRTRRVVYPGGRVIVESTDLRHSLAQIDDAASPPSIVHYSYDNGNRVVARAYRNGTVANYAYNANDWVLLLEHSSGAMRIAGFGYAFDKEGNKRFEEKRHNLADSEAYQYDAIYRLIDFKVGTLAGSTVPVPVTQTAYNLDPVGNWSSIVRNGISEFRTHSEANEILSIDAHPVAHDDNGNLIQDTAYAYAYDEDNRLVQATRLATLPGDPRIVAQYTYDALGRRVVKLADAAGILTETRYFHDGIRMIEEQDGAGTTQATYVYGNSIDEVLTMDRGAQTFYYHQNTLGSVAALTDSAANVVERYAYDAYGCVTITDGQGTPIPVNPWGTPHSAIGNSYTFSGRQLDEETGLYYYRARYYDCAKGRFLQRDSLDYVDGMNLYAYVRNSPMNAVDPTGLKCCEIDKDEKGNDKIKVKKFPDYIASAGRGGFDVKWQVIIWGKDLKKCEFTQFISNDTSMWGADAQALTKEQVLDANKNLFKTKATNPFSKEEKDDGWGDKDNWRQFTSDTIEKIPDHHYIPVPSYKENKEDKYYAYKRKVDAVIKVRDKTDTTKTIAQHPWGYEFRNYAGDAPTSPVEGDDGAGFYSHYGIADTDFPFDKSPAKK